MQGALSCSSTPQLSLSLSPRISRERETPQNLSSVSLSFPIISTRQIQLYSFFSSSSQFPLFFLSLLPTNTSSDLALGALLLGVQFDQVRFLILSIRSGPSSIMPILLIDQCFRSWFDLFFVVWCRSGCIVAQSLCNLGFYYVRMIGIRNWDG